MLLTVRFLSPMVDLTTVCLWMLGLFLQVAFAARQGADYLLKPWGREMKYLPHVLAALMVSSQAWRVERVWQALGALAPWLLLPLGLCAAVLPLMGLIRLGRGKRA